MRTYRLYPLFLLLVTCATLTSGEEFTLGLLIPYEALGSDKFPGMYYAPAIIQALEDVNNRSGLLPGHHLSFIWNDTKCDETKSIQALTYLVHEKQVSAIIGPACSCTMEARLASALDIPMISYMCNEPLYDSVKYSTFARTKVQVELPKLSTSLVMLLQKFNWSQVAIVYENSSYYISVKDRIVKEFENNNINVRMQKSIPTFSCYVLLKFNISCNPTNIGDLDVFMTGIFKELKDNARIVIFISDFPFGRRTLLYAHDQGMTSGDYAFIMLQLDQQRFILNQWIPEQYYLLSGVPDDRLCDYYEALEPVIVVEIKPTDTKSMTFREFREQVKAKFGDPIFGNVTRLEKWDVPYIAAYLYDAVYQYARALNETLERNEPTTGRNIIAKMLNSGYESKSGARVFMNGDGTADFADLGIVDIRWDSSSRANNCNSNHPSAEKVGIIDVSQETPYLNITVASIKWPQGKGAPSDSPMCGFDRLKCRVAPTSSWTPNGTNRQEVLIGGVVAFVGVVVIILLVITTRHFMFKRKVESLLWKINYNDISWARTSASASSSFDEAEDVISDASTRKTSTQFTFTNFGFYKGNRVTVKQVGTKAIDLTKGILLELKQMRDFHHENCVQFFGATIDAPNVCIVSAFCPRTLKDFLMCSDVRLDKTFISSLVSDIAKGMAYLHSTELKSHGSLKSSNCLIDSRWTLKICDYGLTSLKSKCNLSSKSASEDMFWTAPELLRDFNCPLRGTQKGDVYSFAIILQEFHTRRGPYSNNNISAKDIIKKVANAEEPVFRPHVSNFIEDLEDLRDLMKICWEEDPDNRPDFIEIKRRIHRTIVTKGMKTNIFDSMIYMMENYADNLEDLVAERTGQLIEAKRETEELLYKILPRSVAEQLKKGKSVEAENFDEVSIYFSDIVGFTELSSESSPMQIVTLLNDLYTLFDDIISEYRVYKVETIGDAYMVVSGLPIRIGNEHAGEISRMALHLLDTVKQDFIVRHKPDFKLDLRIGIHSGPVVAGVVGNTMPRYCLFGDTVNTASRMESSGEALKIHISEATKKILDSMRGFLIEERGEVNLKGKGKMQTYWLVDYPQRRADRPPRSPRRATRRETMLNFFPVVSEEFKVSCITRSSSLRRSLKSASNNPVTKLPVIKVVANDEAMEEQRSQNRKESTHSITRV